MPPELRRWLLILRVPLALLGVFVFFALYNRFLLDSNLRNLRTSFTLMDGSMGVGQAEAALLLVDQTLTSQMAQEETDLRAVASLQYSRGALASDQRDRPPDDAQMLVKILEEDLSESQSPAMKSMDGVASSLQDIFRKAALLPRQALGKSLSPEIDSARFQEAAELERRGRAAEALVLYRELLRAYPDYIGRTSLKLRVGALLQKSNDFPGAERFYREALAQARDPREIDVSRQSINGLQLARVRARKAAASEKKISNLQAGPDRQQAAFKLGSEWIRSSDFNRAAQAFRDAFDSDPEGDLALPALFKQAWCLRTAGRLEESFSRFSEILRRAPGTEWSVSALLQLAELYRATGNLRASAELYERATSEQTKDAGLTALAYVQAGCAYEFDLQNPGKAQIFLRDLAKKFPASSYSSAGRKLEKLRIKKSRLATAEGPAAAVPGSRPAPPTASGNLFAQGSPVINWLESFLPVFVSVFTDRLSKYMEAVGEKELERRFTEVEFGELVVREVQRRFPGQVTGIQTKIHPDGFVGSGNVHLGMLKFPVEAKLGILVENSRPHAVIHSIKIGKIPLPEALLKFLEIRVNSTIDQTKYLLKVKEYKLNEGYAWISVELAE
ncbi:MAG: tetratricopeptide repeat protein [Candidatus Omnitrophota bacterium]|nr:tetratricopeptide repeat protein [Candidatus Omnitrophota bacterium]